MLPKSEDIHELWSTFFQLVNDINSEDSNAKKIHSIYQRRTIPAACKNSLDLNTHSIYQRRTIPAARKNSLDLNTQILIQELNVQIHCHQGFLPHLSIYRISCRIQCNAASLSFLPSPQSRLGRVEV